FGADSAITADRLWIIAIAIAVTVACSATFRWTRFGAATEAVAENPLAASALGLSPDRIAAVNWALGSALAAFAGVLIAPILFLSIDALGYTVLRGLAAALVGRFRSFWLTLAGAFGIGVVESLLGTYIDHRGIFKPVTDRDGLLFGEFTASSVSRSVAFLIIVVVLAIGGTALPLRHEILDRLPALGSGSIRWPMVALATGVTAAVALTVPDDWATALVISLSFAIICLSIVLVTGYVGQVSLAQFALAGFGAWISGRLAADHGLPFLVVTLVAVAAAIPVGALLALPALRTRGVSLAVLTLGVSVMAYELVFSNGALVGGFLGTRVEPPTVFGWSVDAQTHPGRYAIVVLVALTGASLVVANIRRGRIGRRLIAVRGNERAAAALGINVASAKLYAFAVGAAIAALGGTMLAFRQPTINYATFAPFLSIAIVVYAVIGGVGFITGAFFAAPFAAGGLGAKTFDAIGFSSNTLNLFAGALLLVTLMANPNGIAYANDRAVRRFRHRVRPKARSRPAIPVANDDVESRPPARLAIDHLTVRFGGVVAVDNASLVVEPGEVVGLIGPNGAGKTTIIDAVTGFVKADARSLIHLNESDVRGASPSQRARAGLGRSFQSVELFDDLTVAENLLAASDDRSRAIYATELVRPARPALPRDVWEIVQAFGLESDLHAQPDELPFGRRRLVAVARTLASRPAVLLLDEPAAGLSDAESRELGEVISRLAHDRGLAVLLVEHDISFVGAFCDRIIVLDFGQVIATGPPNEVLRDELVIAAYLGDAGPPSDHVEVGLVPKGTT
ncbi:MAG: branched-chain amino acid ABC transporter permease/ATP-binding protein, partial [Acidimicrobiia bacterium]